MSSPSVSIIVPVYTVEDYLRQCIDSILAQTFYDFELLLIDDGSPDNCGRICDSYAEMDPRVKVFHQENGGLSSARNTGLEHARGRYITMVDADDYLMYREYIQIHLDGLVENDAQMTICGIVSEKTDYPPRSIEKKVGSIAVVSGEEFSLMKSLPARCYYGHAGAKLYRSELFDGIRFPVGHYVEDNAIAHRLIFPCDRIVILDTPMYGYRIRQDSILRSAERDLLRRDVILAFQDRIDYFTEMGCTELAHKAEQQMIRHLSLYK